MGASFSGKCLREDIDFVSSLGTTKLTEGFESDVKEALQKLAPKLSVQFEFRGGEFIPQSSSAGKKIAEVLNQSGQFAGKFVYNAATKRIDTLYDDGNAKAIAGLSEPLKSILLSYDKDGLNELYDTRPKSDFEKALKQASKDDVRSLKRMVDTYPAVLESIKIMEAFTSKYDIDSGNAPAYLSDLLMTYEKGRFGEVVETFRQADFANALKKAGAADKAALTRLSQLFADVVEFTKLLDALFNKYYEVMYK